MTTSDSRRHPTRRQVVQGAIQGAGAVAALSAVAPSAAARLSGHREQLRMDAALLQRASFGYRTDDFGWLQKIGHEAWLQEQLNPASIDDSALDSRLSSFEWLNWTGEEMRDHPTKEVWEIAHEARAARLVRAVYSKRLLFERTVEFWTDHFNIFGSTDDTFVLKIVDDRQVIRANAFGRFSNLLRASAGSPAMLAYLDNDTNVVGAAQENYARELMELHTLGVDGPYTETDVRELARCFTGWGFVKPWQSGEYGTFRFRDNDHDFGQKVVLGNTIPAGGGLSDGLFMLDVLASHPKTIDFVTRKMARWFLGYAPPEQAITTAKARWVATGGQMSEVIASLLSPATFFSANPTKVKKLKRPMHWIASVYRATGVDIPDPMATIWHIWGLGQVPYQWSPPNGYPDSESAWAYGLLLRWKQASDFCNGWYWSTGHTIDYMRGLLQGAPKSNWATVIDRLLTGGTMDRFEVARIQDYLDTFPNETNQSVGEAFELCTSAPSFQLY